MENTKKKSIFSFFGLWKARDELSFRNIRSEYWTAWLLFPLSIILSDLRFLDQEMELFGQDSVILIMVAYSIGWLTCAFFPAKLLSFVLKICTIIIALSLVLQFVIAPGELRLIFFLLFHLAIGVCVACSFYVYVFTLQNAERFFGMFFIIIYYCSIDMFWGYDAFSDFMKTGGSIIFMALFIITVFRGQSENFPIKKIKKGDEKKGCYIVFFIYIIFFIIDFTNVYIDYEAEFGVGIYLGIGGLMAVVTAFLIQMIFNKSVWHLWNIFIILSVAGSALFLIEGTIPEVAGSLLYGMANSIGYFAAIYMMAGAGKRNGSLLFFKIACFIIFLTNSVLALVFDSIFMNIEVSFDIVIFAIILISASVCMLMIPVLFKRLFDTDWSDGYRQLNMPEYEDHAAVVDKIDRLKELGLTTREREIFTLLLTDESPKQIAGILKVSTATVNFHTNNLYRKLNIQSRTQLFADYSHIQTEHSGAGR